MRVLQTIVALALALPVVGTQHLLLSEEEEHHTALRAGHHHDGEHRELTWVAKAVCDNFLANRTFFPNWRDVYWYVLVAKRFLYIIGIEESMIL
jgi:hypothetical protein